MSYTLHYPDLKLKDILDVLPSAEIKVATYKDHVIYTILWRDPDNKKDGKDLYGVELRFKDILQGPNRGMFVNKKILQERSYRDNLEINIDAAHALCLNGQSLLDDKLKLKGHNAWYN